MLKMLHLMFLLDLKNNFQIKLLPFKVTAVFGNKASRVSVILAIGLTNNKVIKDFA